MPIDLRILWWNTSWEHAPKIDHQIDAVLGLKAPPDVIALSEVDAARAKRWRQRLHAEDYIFMRSAPGLDPNDLRVVLASRVEMQTLRGRRFPGIWPRALRSARVEVGANGIDIRAVQIPNGSSYKWIKIDHLQALRRGLEPPHGRPQVLCGDFNTPRSEVGGNVITWGQTKAGKPANDPGKTYPRERPWNADLWDQGERAVLEGIPQDCGMQDVFHSIYPDEIEATYVPKYQGKRVAEEKGRRFDRMYASTSLAVVDVHHHHSWRRDDLSDHSGLEATLRVTP